MSNGILKAGKKDNSRRRYPGVGGRRHNPTNVADKQADAKERQAAWSALSPVQQLKELDRRLGEGKGAERQRAKIKATLDKRSQKASEPAEAPKPDKVKAKDRRVQERAERSSK